MELFNVDGSIGREKVTTGRNVTPSSLVPEAGVRLVTVSGIAVDCVNWSVWVAVLPAASIAVTTRVYGPAESLDRSSAWLKVPSELNATGIVEPPSKA